MRPLGIALSGVAAAVGMWFAVQRWRTHLEVADAAIGASAFSLLVLLLWTFRFTREWVRVPADGYAERLAETVESFGSTAGATTRETPKKR
jgi:hypothetical protein